MIYRSKIDIPIISIDIPIVKGGNYLSGEIESRREMGARIRAIRNSKGLSGRELASTSGVSQAFISEVERGLVAISSEKLMMIARALGVGLDSLMNSSQVLTDQSLLQPSTLSEVRIPAGLTAIAKEYGLSFQATLQLLESAHALMAHRSSDGSPVERSVDDWRSFYLRVKDYIEEE